MHNTQYTYKIHTIVRTVTKLKYFPGKIRGIKYEALFRSGIRSPLKEIPNQKRQFKLITNQFKLVPVLPVN